MALRFKSIQKPPTKTDGIRICIMRRPGEGLDWDIWMPVLAPSHQLLTEYHHGEVDWERFEQRFAKEVLKKHQKYLQAVVDMAQSQTVTLLCWEDSPEMCHRRLIAEACQKLDSD